MKEIICRYAPSPSGVMHIGNVATSLLTWLDCRQQGGKLIFRMEDLDRDRCKSEYARKIADDIKWLGLDWDCGWSEAAPEYAQSSRDELYDNAFELLKSKGLVYPCFCSRNQRTAASPPQFGEYQSKYSCHCGNLTEAERTELIQIGKRHSWKVRVPNEEICFTDSHYGEIKTNPADEGDFIIRRSDGLFAYQLAVSVDDMDMGVTRVVRGRDLLSSTAKQIWLIRELGGTPPEYCHAPLLITDETHKMSKRYGDLSMEKLREKYSPSEIIGKIAYILGLCPNDNPVSPAELLSGFSWDKITTQDIMFKTDSGLF